MKKIKVKFKTVKTIKKEKMPILLHVVNIGKAKKPNLYVVSIIHTNQPI